MITTRQQAMRENAERAHALIQEWRAAFEPELEALRVDVPHTTSLMQSLINASTALAQAEWIADGLIKRVEAQKDSETENDVQAPTTPESAELPGESILGPSDGMIDPSPRSDSDQSPAEPAVDILTESAYNTYIADLAYHTSPNESATPAASDSLGQDAAPADDVADDPATGAHAVDVG